MPEQNFTRVCFTAEMSDDGSLDRVLLSMSYVQFVGPEQTLEGAFFIAERKALLDGTKVLGGDPGGMAEWTG